MNSQHVMSFAMKVIKWKNGTFYVLYAVTLQSGQQKLKKVTKDWPFVKTCMHEIMNSNMNSKIRGITLSVKWNEAKA